MEMIQTKKDKLILNARRHLLWRHRGTGSSEFHLQASFHNFYRNTVSTFQKCNLSDLLTPGISE